MNITDSESYEKGKKVGTKISYLHLLTVLLVLLKVFNLINISWWIVFLPSLISVGILFLVLGFILLIFLGAIILAVLLDK